MWKKVRDYMLKYKMMAPGDRAIIALSGGADSVCLLSVLKKISQEMPDCGWEFKAVHVHHGLRGEEADRDARFAEQLCCSLEMPFAVICHDVSGYARGHGCSEEEAGRILRYQTFAREAQSWGAKKVALAHHKDDNAETMIHHLARGSGLRGLGGIQPVQMDRIRPLLCVSRAEIIAYLEDEGLAWMEDSTNASGDYTRNRIRNQIIPLMKTQVNEQAVENILRAGRLFAQADEYLQQTAERIWEAEGTCSYDREMNVIEAAIPIPVLGNQPEIVRSYLFGRMLEAVVPYRKNITHRHYAALDELLSRQANSRYHLPGDVIAVRGYEDFFLKRNQESEKEPEIVEADMQFEVFPWKKDGEFPKNGYTKWFDYDKIKGTLSVRTRQSGDYFVLSDGGKKMVNRYMIDEKIPKNRRDEILLLADGNHIVWIIGYRISEYYKIDKDTKTILQARWDGGENHGR